MPDIRIDVEFFQHPKTVKLERRLGLSGIKALLQLWMWAAKNRPNGIFSNMIDEDVEIAASWTGEPGAFCAVLLELRWLDVDETTGYSLHNWAARNTWVADSTTRGDKARFMRMASTHPTLYQKMAARGITEITKEDYIKLVGDKKNNATLTARQREPNVTLTPSPSPSPDPDIKDSPKLSTEGEDEKFKIEIEKALKTYRSFKNCRWGKDDQDRAWIVGLYQNYQIDIAKSFQRAHKWMQEKKLNIKDPRAYLENWVQKTHKLLSNN